MPSSCDHGEGWRPRRPSRRYKRVLHWCLQKWYVLYLNQVAGRQVSLGSRPDPTPYFGAWHRLLSKHRSDRCLADQYRCRRAIFRSLRIWVESCRTRLRFHLVDIRRKLVWTRWKLRYVQRRCRQRRRAQSLMIWRRTVGIRTVNRLATKLVARTAWRRIVRFARSAKRSIARTSPILRVVLIRVRMETLVVQFAQLDVRHQQRQCRRQRMLLRMCFGQLRDAAQSLIERDRLLRERSRWIRLRNAMRTWQTASHNQRQRLSAAIQIVEGLEKAGLGSALAIWRRFLTASRRQASYLIQLEMACRRVRWCLTVRRHLRLWRQAIITQCIASDYWRSWVRFVRARKQNLVHRSALQMRITGDGATSMKVWQENRVKTIALNAWLIELAMKYCTNQLRKSSSQRTRSMMKRSYYTRWEQSLYNRIRQ